MHSSSFLRRAVVVAALASPLAPAHASAKHASSERASSPRGGTRLAADVVGTVTDSTSAHPLGSAQISVMQGTHIVLNTITDDFGRYRAHNLDAGAYTVSVHMLGFRPMSRAITVDGTAGTVRVDFHLPSVAVSLAAVEVHAGSPLAVNTRTGDQTFKQDDYHGAPTATTSQILQQSIAGAARAPTGEVHIRGQHAEYTYYVDGVPVPSGISGSLNELFDPAVVNQLSFQTGGWDAEYGNKNTAIVNVATKIPAGGLHMDVSSYMGDYNTNGQSLSMSTNVSRLGLFGSFAHQVTDMRREPQAYDTLTFAPNNFHNHGQDDFAFGKVSYTASPNDVLNLDMNWSQTKFQIPYNPALTSSSDDNQRDVNSFINLGWRHQFGNGNDIASTGSTVGAGSAASAVTAGGPSELFVGAFYRYGTLDYTPGVNDQAQFFFYPDTTTAYNLMENRRFSTLGLKVDYTTHPTSQVEFKTGVLAQRTTGNEVFQATAQDGTLGPGSASDLTGSDVGGYAQVAYAPIEKFEVRTGLRYDAHTAPFAGTATQLSPRIRLNFFPSPSTSLYAYYGRMFIPTNVEELRTITDVALGSVAQPTLPERDNFYELGLVHRFPVAGLVAKLSGYYKESSPGLDDATIPGSAIVTSVNIDKIWVKGIDGVLEIRPSGPFSGYINASIIHAYGQAPITGGFLPSAPPSNYFDLDHDQRISVVASGTYTLSKFFFSSTATYGSGLTNGTTTDDLPNADYGTGLLSMNSAFKVDPSTIFSASAGYTIIAGKSVIRPQVYVENLFNTYYLLKGAFFSGAQVGRPRTVQFRLNVGV